MIVRPGVIIKVKNGYHLKYLARKLWLFEHWKYAKTQEWTFYNLFPVKRKILFINIQQALYYLGSLDG